MIPRNSAIAKILIGISLVIGGIFGGYLIYDGVGALGKLDQVQLDIPIKN